MLASGSSGKSASKFDLSNNTSYISGGFIHSVVSVLRVTQSPWRTSAKPEIRRSNKAGPYCVHLDRRAHAFASKPRTHLKALSRCDLPVRNADDHSAAGVPPPDTCGAALSVCCNFLAFPPVPSTIKQQPLEIATKCRSSFVTPLPIARVAFRAHARRVTGRSVFNSRFWPSVWSRVSLIRPKYLLSLFVQRVFIRSLVPTISLCRREGNAFISIFSSLDGTLTEMVYPPSGLFRWPQPWGPTAILSLLRR